MASQCNNSTQFMRTLNAAFLLGITVQVALLGGAFGEFRTGRATFYDAHDGGSCELGPLWQGPLGNNVAAMATRHPDYKKSYTPYSPRVEERRGGHCGTCYEITCNRAMLKDSWSPSWQLDRTGANACKDPMRSVVVQIVDECPCDSNQHWCCGDMDHFDLNKSVFLQLADEVQGVIGLRYRKVDCSHTVNKTSPTKDLESVLPTEPVQAGPEKPFGSSVKPTFSKKEELERQKMKAMSVYEGGFSSSFVDGGLVPYKPQNGDGFGGRPAWCSVISPNRGVSILGRSGDFRKAVQIDFWVKLNEGVPDISIALASKKRLFNSVRLQNLKMVSKDYASNLGLYSIKIKDLMGNGRSTGLRRGSKSTPKVDSIVFVNNLKWNQGLCIDSVMLMHPI